MPPEFHADDLIEEFNELGIEIMYSRSGGPEIKGSVERFFSTQSLGLIHNLPGTPMPLSVFWPSKIDEGAPLRH